MRHRIILEEHDETFAAGRPIIAGIRLDLGFAFVIFVDHPGFTEPLEGLVGIGVPWRVCQILRRFWTGGFGRACGSRIVAVVAVA